MDDLLERLRAQVERATDPIEPSEVSASRRGARRSRTLNVAAVMAMLAVVVGVVALGSDEREGPTSSAPRSGPRNLGLTVDRIVAPDEPNGTRMVLIEFDGELPEGPAVYVDDITSVVAPPGLAYTTQDMTETVWVCADRHFGFGPGAAGDRSIDVLIPVGWLDLGTDPAPGRLTVPFAPAADGVSGNWSGKILGCGPYKGYVQYSIWGVSADPSDVRVAVEGDTIRVIVGPSTLRTTVEIDGVQVGTPSGWSAEPSSNEQGEVLFLRDGDSGAELHIVIRPTPSEALPAEEVLSVLSAFGDDSAVITDVEGGYALYAALDCPAEPCERVVAFAYNLSLAEFTDLSSSL